MNSKIFIVTGAGISAESGLSTFRGTDGIWNKYDLNKVCNFSHFARNAKNESVRKEIFSFYQELLLLVEGSKPNKAHYEIANLQKKYGSDRVLSRS